MFSLFSYNETVVKQLYIDAAEKQLFQFKQDRDRGGLQGKFVTKKSSCGMLPKSKACNISLSLHLL